MFTQTPITLSLLPLAPPLGRWDRETTALGLLGLRNGRQVRVFSNACQCETHWHALDNNHAFGDFRYLPFTFPPAGHLPDLGSGPCSRWQVGLSRAPAGCIPRTRGMPRSQQVPDSSENCARTEAPEPRVNCEHGGYGGHWACSRREQGRCCPAKRARYSRASWGRPGFRDGIRAT